MSLPIQMADAVLLKIKEAFPDLSSERRYVPSLELKDTKETRIRLTMQFYTHINAQEQADAIKSLPGLTPQKDGEA